jgi:hypothetical protein
MPLGPRKTAEPCPFLALIGSGFLSATLAPKFAERYCVRVFHANILVNAM